VQRNSRNAFWLVLLLGAGAVSGTGQTRGGIAITPQGVVSAMAESGWKITARQVKFLSQVTASGRDDGLRVVKVMRGMGDTLRVELRCHDRRACLPFYVLINGVGAADTPLQTSTRVDSSRDPAVLQKPLLRSGDAATLVFASKALRITIPVICLQSGGRGQKIRVSSTDHKRFYKAEIVGPGMLTATTL
jgi:hypothetical protein